MRLLDIVPLTRRLSTRAIVGRGAALSALVLLERALTPATAWAVLGRPVLEKLAFAVALGTLFSVRTFAQHAFKARTEAELLERVVVRLIDGDVLRANVLPNEDARAELGLAVFHAAQGVSMDVPLLVGDGVAASLLAIFVVAREPARLAGIAVGMTLVAAAALLTMRRSMERALTGAWTARRYAHDAFVDAIEGRLDVVAAGRREAFRSQIEARARAWAAAGSRVALEALVSNKLPLLIIAMGVAGAIVALGKTGRSALTITTEEAALLASMTPAFSGFAQRMVALGRAQRWMDLVAGALAEPRGSFGGNRAPPHLPAPIAFERVSFRYEGMPDYAVRDLSLVWGRERVLAFAGANGSGKSTCLRLLLGLAQPQTGGLSVAGIRLDDVDLDTWRGNIAYLPQRPYLPPRSDVRAAVRFLAAETTDESIERALDRVGLLAKLRHLGDDPLAARVDELSMGERQRVALARLLCQRPALVLLDEPDANLDRDGIGLVADLVRELARDAMVALAAHTVELLEVADRVMVLDRGRVIRDEVRVRLVAP